MTITSRLSNQGQQFLITAKAVGGENVKSLGGNKALKSARVARSKREQTDLCFLLMLSGTFCFVAAAASKDWHCTESNVPSNPPSCATLIYW